MATAERAKDAIMARARSAKRKAPAGSAKGEAIAVEPLLQELVARVKRVTKPGEQHSIRIQLVGEPGFWVIETIEGEVRLSEGAGPSSPRVEVIADPAVIKAILSGKKEGKAAFLAGGIRVRGDVRAVERLSAAMGTHKP